MFCNIYQTVGRVGFSRKDIESIVKTILDFLKKKNFEVSVHLVGDKKMKKINKHYRGMDKVTDVLAFALQDFPLRPSFAKGFGMAQQGFGERNKDLGDIFISIPQVKRQAKEQKILYKEELVRILAHGVLHLNGFDHMKPKEEKEMFDLQEKIVKKFIYGD